MNVRTVPSGDTPREAQADQRLPLDAIFAPRAVAVIGATENAGSVGRAILSNPDCRWRGEPNRESVDRPPLRTI